MLYLLLFIFYCIIFLLLFTYPAILLLQLILLLLTCYLQKNLELVATPLLGGSSTPSNVNDKPQTQYNKSKRILPKYADTTWKIVVLSSNECLEAHRAISDGKNDDTFVCEEQGRVRTTDAS